MNRDAVIREIESALERIPHRDAAWCRSRLEMARRRMADGNRPDQLLGRIAARVTAATNRVELRRQSVPRPDYDPSLPIAAHRDAIVAAIKTSPVLIVAGETGSGKTTQLPKMCLEAGRGVRGLIACTQPRRIAASAMASRVAEELRTDLGGLVGFEVRFRNRSSPDGLIKFMTDGILLAEIPRDPDLAAYDTILIDEAHERSLNIDFLLGYMKLLLPRRPDLRLIITSATIDTEKFARHFGNAPVIEVSGRGYPVDILYHPLEPGGDASEAGERDLYQGIAEAVRRLTRQDAHGDILVFLSGEREIHEAGDHLERQRFAQTEILPLYARLSSAEQQRVFHPGPQRRIILATNVAETSLTVPRIRFVIDSGLARISRYAHRSRIQRLPIEPVSQASANQRAGRCGRLSPGTCVRLYSEEDFVGRPAFTEPEILRTSLGSVILRMLVMDLGAVEDFPFLDPPAPRMINDAYALLVELNAIDENRNPTELGRRIDRWPLDVRLARMVLEGSKLGCIEDVMVLAAALSIQDPRERPLDSQQAADDAHRRFADERSDFTALLRLWDYLRRQRHETSGSRFRKLCRQEFLNWQRVLEWFDLYQQLRDQAREDGIALSGKHGEHDAVHRALLSGLLSHVGRKDAEDDSYQGARNRSFRIFPGSGLFGRIPTWIMAAEIVETARAWGRLIAAIQPEWIEIEGRHLLKYHHFEPHWSRRRGAVLAWEQVSLFGLVIVEKRRVDYARIDLRDARRIFILEALVRGEFDTRATFMRHNRALREEIEKLEHKRRKRDVLASEAVQFDFFDERVPETVHGAAGFEKWLTQIGAEGRRQLQLGYDVLMREDAGAAPVEQFPDFIDVGGTRLPLEYRFAPGDPADGVTLRVPLELLNTLDAGKLQWVVPGLLHDKLAALIRALPKPLRRVLTPVPQFADALAASLESHRDEPLIPACARELTRMTGLELSPPDLDETQVPEHLRLRIEVCDDFGEVLGSSRDLAALKERFGREARLRFMHSEGRRYHRDGLTAWDFGPLERQVRTDRGAHAWPALVDQQTGAGLRLFDTAEDAAGSHAAGVLRLIALAIADKLAWLRKHSGLSRDALAAWAPLGSREALVGDFVEASLWRAVPDAAAVRDAESFGAAVEQARQLVGIECQRQSELLHEILPAASAVRANLRGQLTRLHPESASDIEDQLADLIYPGFLTEIESGRLQHYPRYLAALAARLRALEQDPNRDRQRQALVSPWWNHYQQRLGSGAPYDEALDAFRWLLHEYRVSVFAQKLGTAVKVSDKRLREAWRAVEERAA